MCGFVSFILLGLNQILHNILNQYDLMSIYKSNIKLIFNILPQIRLII
jgi:hypothetical protein